MKLENKIIITLSEVFLSSAKNFNDRISNVSKELLNPVALLFRRKDLRNGEEWNLENVSLRIKDNEKVCIFFTKEETLDSFERLLCGLISPNRQKTFNIGRSISVSGCRAGMKLMLSLEENIRFKLSVMGMRAKDIDGALSDILQTCNLSNKSNSLLYNIDAEDILKVSHEMAIKLNPDVLIFRGYSHPKSGDDYYQNFWLRVNDNNQNFTKVFLVTKLKKNSAFFDRLIILHRAKVYSDTVKSTGLRILEKLLFELDGRTGDDYLAEDMRAIRSESKALRREEKRLAMIKKQQNKKD